MKPNDIQRDIRSPHCRSSGQPPPIGRITRLRDSEPAYDRNGRRVRSRGSHRSGRRGNPVLGKLIFRWSIALGVVTALIIGAAISFWILPYLQQRDSAAVANQMDHDTQVRVASRFPSPGEDEAIRLVRRAITNRDPAKVAALFHTGAVDPQVVVDFFKNSDARDGAVTRCSWLSSIDGDGILLEGVRVDFKGNDKPSERLALLTPDNRGIWKMDFEAFARSVRPSWRELLENNAEHATVRVLVGRDFYFNGPFSDDKQWSCYGITSPDVDVLLRGYCKAGSAEDNAMGRMFTDGVNLCRATLEIRRVKDGDSKQFEITRVLAKDWVVPDQSLAGGDPAGKAAF